MKVIERINKQIKIACSENRDCLSNFGLNWKNVENKFIHCDNFYGRFCSTNTRKIIACFAASTESNVSSVNSRFHYINRNIHIFSVNSWFNIESSFAQVSIFTLNQPARQRFATFRLIISLVNSSRHVQNMLFFFIFRR